MGIDLQHQLSQQSKGQKIRFQVSGFKVKKQIQPAFDGNCSENSRSILKIRKQSKTNDESDRPAIAVFALNKLIRFVKICDFHVLCIP